MSEEMKNGVLHTINDIVVKTDTTSMTEAQRKLFTILTSFVTASYWTNPNQQKLINCQHTWMIGYISKDFENYDEILEVIDIFVPITHADNLVLEHDENAAKWFLQLIIRLPMLYNRYKNGDDFVRTRDEEGIKRIVRNSCFAEELTAKLNKSKEALNQYHENRKIKYRIINKEGWDK